MNSRFPEIYRAMKPVKNVLLFTVFFTVLFLNMTGLRAQNKDWGLGFRIGNPTGITVKRYLGAANALEVALGTNYNNDGFELLAHYLFHFPINGAPGLDWYYGFGAQIQSHDRGEREVDNDIEMGADGVLGLEYSFANAPVAIFLDGMLFLEIIDDPLNLDLDLGIGLRYNF